MKEIWKDVVGYEGYYQVSSLGRVKSMTRISINRIGHKKMINGKVLSHTLTHGYPEIWMSVNGNKKSFKVHKLMQMAFNLGSGEVDHINRIKDDNRLCNMRIVTHKQNNYNRAPNKSSSSKYKGVSRYRADNTWQSHIMIDGKCIHIGIFKCEIKAAKAYDKKAKELFGEYAYLNIS